MGLTVYTLPAHKGVLGTDSPAECRVTWEIRWQVLPPPELKASLRKGLLPPKGPREQYCDVSKMKGSFVMGFLQYVPSTNYHVTHVWHSKW